MNAETTLVETTRVSKSKSLRMSLPKRIAERLGVGPEDIVGFYSTEDGMVCIRKLS